MPYTTNNRPVLDGLPLEPMTTEEGGTGTLVVPDYTSRTQIVTEDMLGQASGPVKANAHGKLDPAELGIPVPAVTLAGPTVLNGSAQTVTYTITNYCSFVNYNVGLVGKIATLVNGSSVSATPTFSVNNETIDVSVPLGTGLFTITVNGKDFSVTCGSVTAVLSAPTIIVPVNASTNVAIDVFAESTLISSSNGIPVTHSTTDWQLATDVGFTNVVKETLDDNINLLSWAILALDQGTVYFLRVRYKDNHGNHTPWSNTVRFTTAGVSGNQYIPSLEYQTISSKFADNETMFGLSQAVSRDKSRLVVGQRYFQSNMAGKVCPGRVLIHNLDQSGLYKYAKNLLRPGGPMAFDLFGQSLAINGAGNILLVGCPGDKEPVPQNGQGTFTPPNTPPAIGSVGAVYLYKHTQADGWVYWSTLTASVPSINVALSGILAIFGDSVAMSDSGDRLFITETATDDIAVGDLIKVYIFKTTDFITWTLETTLQIPVITDASESGVMISPVVTTSQDGKTVAVGCGTKSFGSGLQGRVSVFNYNSNTNTWGQGFEFSAQYVNQATPPDQNTYSSDFGSTVKLSKDGSVLIVGSWEDNENYSSLVPGKLRTGAIYVYAKNGSNWERVGRYVGAECETGNYFGYSVDITGDNNLIAIGCIFDDMTELSAAADTGAVYLFAKSGNTYVQVSKVHITDYATGDMTGKVNLLDDGSALIIGSPGRLAGTFNMSGVVTVLK